MIGAVAGFGPSVRIAAVFVRIEPVAVRIEPVLVRMDPVLVRMEPVEFEARASAVWIGRESVSGTAAFNRFAAEALESIRRSPPWYPNPQRSPASDPPREAASEIAHSPAA